MSVPLPDRYRLEVRFGRDEDIEEWLSTDTLLDRPVLVRLLGPETTAARREQFVASARALAAVNHVHLGQVYAAAVTADGAYTVTEWTGGVTTADRIRSDEPMMPEEFLPNAAGLAEAVAVLHASGTIHGAIDPSAISFATAHPAKLVAFGRVPRYHDDAGEVAALAGALAAAATGRLDTSGSIEGFDEGVAAALATARRGALAASGLAAALRAAPTIVEPEPPSRRPWSWRWMVPAIVLLLMAVGLGALARLGDEGTLSPFQVPSTTIPPTSTEPSTTVQPPSIEGPGTPVPVTAAGVYDPFGDEQERGAEIPNLTDGDPATAWRTERYFTELGRVKPGVGVTFELDGTPSGVVVTASAGTAYRILWASGVPADFEGWEPLADGRLVEERSLANQLPERPGGVWLLWLTELTPQDGGQYFYSFVYEVEFVR